MTADRTVRYAVQYTYDPDPAHWCTWPAVYGADLAKAQDSFRYLFRSDLLGRRWRLIRITEHTDVIEAPAENYSQDLAVAPADTSGSPTPTTSCSSVGVRHTQHCAHYDDRTGNDRCCQCDLPTTDTDFTPCRPQR